jgi:hypothetical protein
VPGGTAHWMFHGGTNYLDEEGNAPIVINPQPLSITADAVVGTPAIDPFTKIYNGSPYSGFAVRYDGFVAGQTPTVLSGVLSFSGPGATAVNPGNHIVTPGGLTSSNYLISFVNGSLTIGYGACSVSSGPGGVILPPINSDGTSVYNRKGGSTIPVKFRVCDAAGNPIPNAAAVFAGTGGTLTMLSAVRGTVDGANEAGITEIPDVAFRWTTNQWIFNMATANLQSGATYTFRINLALGFIDFSVGVK